MATSGSYSFSVTRDDIIRMAMITIGKIGDAEVPTAQETKDCAMLLNAMVKQWMAKQDFAPGLKVWTRRRGELFLSNSTGQYNLGPSGDNWTASYVGTTLTANASGTALTVASIAGIANGNSIGIQLNSGALFFTTVNGTPSGNTVNIATSLPSQANSSNNVFVYATKATRPELIETAVLRDINNNDIPLNILNLQDYEFLPSKTNVQYLSDPVSIYYEAQLANGVLYTDVAGASDVTKHIHIVYMEAIQDFVNPLDNPEYPQAWYMALFQGLAKMIAPIFNAPWTNEQQQNYQEAVAMARESFGETSTMYFQAYPES